MWFIGGRGTDRIDGPVSRAASGSERFDKRRPPHADLWCSEAEHRWRGRSDGAQVSGWVSGNTSYFLSAHTLAFICEIWAYELYMCAVTSLWYRQADTYKPCFAWRYDSSLLNSTQWKGTLLCSVCAAIYTACHTATAQRTDIDFACSEEVNCSVMQIM